MHGAEEKRKKGVGSYSIRAKLLLEEEKREFNWGRRTTKSSPFKGQEPIGGKPVSNL